MFKTKQQVDNHVRVIQSHLKSDKERNLRGLNFSQLYYKIGEYELSRRYISNYMSVNDKSAVAFKQLGLCLDALGQNEKAFSAYKTSLELEPKQPDLLIKVCEILLQGDIILDPNRTKYWCELAESQFPSNNTVFRLKEKIMEAQDSNPMEIKELILKELAVKPADPFLRIRYLQHLLQQNLILEAFKHAQEIEFKNLSIFNDNMKWYDTLTDILQKYRVDMDNTKESSWEFWLFNITVLEKQVYLSLSEMHSYRKSLVDCANAIISLDQALYDASKVVESLCKERELSSNFILHFQGQLCLHLATFLFKKAKKDHNIWKETIKHCTPLLLLAFHSNPPDLKDSWLGHTTESNRQIVQKWNREGSYRCSQAGHTILSCVKEKRTVFMDRISNYCSGSWREKLYKIIFTKLDHLSKLNTSYFINSTSLKEPDLAFPGPSELKIYDGIAQRQHPCSLHHLVWLGLNAKHLWDLKCNIFEGLQFSVNNLANCNAECLNQLDMDTFLYCAVICARTLREESVNSGYISTDKPLLLPANIMEQFCSPQQLKWWTATYKSYKNELQAELGDMRLTITRGMEIVRCIGQHGLDAKLLCMLSNIFNERAKMCEIKSEKHFLEARVSLFYTTAYPLLQRLKSHQTICPTPNRMFNFNQKEMKMNEILHLIEELKMFQGTQLMNDGDHEKALETFQSIKNPYSSFYQGVIYKKLAAEQISSSKENLTSEMRSKHIIMLSKARDCFHLTLDRLRDNKIDKHPLDQILSTHMEEVEEQLSRIEPDTCINRNDCEILSEDNISSAGTLGEHIELNLSSNYINNSYNNHTNLNSTPKHKSRVNATQNFRQAGGVNYEVRRTESRPSPERLDAQIRNLSMKREQDMASLTETIQLLVDEIKDMKCAAAQESKNQKKLIEELKNEVTDLKKSLGKTKSAPTPNLDDQDFGYLLEEELQNQEYNLPNLYPNYQPRIPQNANIGYPNHLYQNPVYPMYSPYAYGGAVPFVEGQQMQDYRNQMLNQQLIYNQTMLNKLNPQESVAMLQAMNSVFPQGRTSDLGNNMSSKPIDTNLINNQPPITQQQPVQGVPFSGNLIGQSLIASQANITNITSQVSSSATKTQNTKPAPVNVVITSSDPLPSHTTTTSQPTLSVTIPPHHIKTSISQPVQPKGIHNYQIAMPSIPQGQGLFGITEPSIDEKSVKLPQSTKSSIFGNISGLESTFSSPKPQNSSSLSNTSFLSTGTPSTIISKTGDFQTPNNISVISSSSIYITPNASNLNETEVNVSTPGTIIRSALNKSSDSHCSNTSISERYDPLPDYKPIIPLPDVVEVKTGEEDEKVIFKSRAKLYRFINKEWKERGVGELKLLKNNTTEKVRILMRRDHTHKICANHIITSTMTLSLMKNETRAYIWYAPDFADENVVYEKLCARFKTEELAKSFYEAFEKSRLEMASQESSAISQSNVVQSTTSIIGMDDSFGDKFKLKDGSWRCVSCYTTNTQKQTKCVACSAEKSGIETAPSEIKTEKPNIGGFTFSSNPTFTIKETNTIISADTNSQKPSPFSGFTFSKTNSTTGSSFTSPFVSNKPNDQVKISHNTATNATAPILKTLPVLKTSDVPETKLKLNSKGDNKIDFSNANASVEDVEEFVPTAEFTPVIPLPEQVTEQTGEENENVIFEERAKLLRYYSDTKEWKERGLGNIKILVDKKDIQKVRLLMRREIVLKVCCNHFITKDIQFNRMKTEKMNSLTWSAQDYAENEMKTEVFAIRFKTKELCDKFYDSIITAQSKMKQAPNENNMTKTSELVINTPKSLTQQGFGDKFKPKSGSWSCSACYINNNSESNYCVACDSPKDDTIPKKDKNIFKSTPTSTFTFGIPAGGNSSIQNSSPQLAFGIKQAPVTAGFTFGMSKSSSTPESTSTNSPFKFCSPTTSSSTTSFSFGIPEISSQADDSKTTSTFANAGSGKFEFVFSPKSPKVKSPPKNSTKPENESDGEDIYASDEEGDNIYFTPVIPLPEKIAVTTGEENEEVLYCHRAKLFRFSGHEWKERGLGDVKILKNPETKKIRVLMRRSQILKICLNHMLTPDMEYLPKDDKTWLFTANDFSDGEFTVQQFCIRFKTEDIAKAFKSAIDSALASLIEISPDSTVDRVEQSDESDIEVTFETKVTEEEKNLARKYLLPDNFYAYKYREKCKGCIGCNPDEYKFPDELKKNESITNTPNTFSFLKAQAALKSTDIVQERKDQTSIFGNDKKVTQQNIFGGKPKSAADLSSSMFGRTIFGQQTSTTENSMCEIKNNLILKPSLFSTPKEESKKSIFGGNVFNPGGSVKSTIQEKSTTENKPEATKIEEKSSYKFGENALNDKLKNLTKYSVNPPDNEPLAMKHETNIFSTAKTTQNIFGALPMTQENTDKKQLPGFLFKTPAVPAEIKEDIPMFKTDTSLSFANIASDNTLKSDTFAQGSDSNKGSSFSWAGAGAPVFGSKQTPKKNTSLDMQKTTPDVDNDETEDGNEAEAADDEYDPHYDPIIEMPDAIVVTTGEEDETKLFCQRAKLFRYDSATKEWKERGVGEIKLLYHPNRNTYRLLLRREQVHKLVLNQLLDKGFVLKTMNLSDRAWCWAGINHAEQPGKGEELAVRFKNSELANEFKKAVESVVQSISDTSYNVHSYSDDDEENVEYQDEYEDEDEDEDERSVMFDKHANLMNRSPSGIFTQFAVGTLQILYDPDLFGARIMMFLDDGSCVSNTIIAVNTTMSISESDCTWSAIDYAADEPILRTLRARFDCTDSAREFHNTFKEGVSYAREADIIDPTPDVFTPDDD